MSSKQSVDDAFFFALLGLLNVERYFATNIESLDDALR